MKRFLIAVLTSCCTFSVALAQTGMLAPTVPVVPSPVLQDGRIQNPGDSRRWHATTTPRLFSANWSPFRNPVVASPSAGQLASAYPYHGYTLPPLPAGVSDPGVVGDARAVSAAPVGTPVAESHRSKNGWCWERIRAWICYRPSKSDLPKLNPVPYTTPLQGMFPCVSVGGAGPCCHPGSYPAIPSSPMLPPGYPAPLPMPAPMPKPGSSDSPPGVMPTRGVSGAALHPALSGRTHAAYVNGAVAPSTSASSSAIPATLPPLGPSGHHASNR
ncbi:MAG: hypothetical protein RMJ56_01025 [Gemmataceae bacterium]|nr:hypothetical protein [Gemmata sp.]MDW8196164.1 hypothetical protein [Gemmataceae bacterium]